MYRHVVVQGMGLWVCICRAMHNDSHARMPERGERGEFANAVEIWLFHFEVTEMHVLKRKA